MQMAGFAEILREASSREAATERLQSELGPNTSPGLPSRYWVPGG